MKQNVLSIPQAANGFPVRRVFRIAVGKVDATGLQKTLDTIVSRLSIHMLPVVLVLIERIEGRPAGGQALIAVFVEQTLPSGGMDGGRTGEHAIEIEYNRVKRFPADERVAWIHIMCGIPCVVAAVCRNASGQGGNTEVLCASGEMGAMVNPP